MPRVLYFHGFASSPNSAKVASLRRILEPEIVLDTPDLNVPSFEHLDFERMVAFALERAAANPPDAIVGSSLGALVVLAVAQRGVAAPLVLIAPAIGVRDRWLTLIPPGDPIFVFHHADGKERPIHRAFFEQIATVNVDDHPPASRVTVIMGRNDESVPFERVLGTWARWEEEGLAPGSKFVEIAEGDHGLTAFVDVIADVILSAAKDRCGRRFPHTDPSLRSG